MIAGTYSSRCSRQRFKVGRPRVTLMRATTAIVKVALSFTSIPVVLTDAAVVLGWLLDNRLLKVYCSTTVVQYSMSPSTTIPVHQ